ncbi:hypothetical protein CEXT_358261 [Caerostris extrusa]|uniref:Major facilitator superfamily (MFS) profile domain-containing protein n=1 Tax=Caerostris extrusa TaxID=172846 RepID=A0AAV4XHJ4_CAEEX|nr:hypothetical protein CEXT_358261 [Caerostris extrusa]
MENKYPIMIVGLSIVTLAMLLLGPSEFLPLNGSVWLSIVALTLLGFSFAAAYVPTFESMFIAAMNGGLEDDINTYSVVSGLWNSMYSLGEVTGPSLGGILSDFFTFPEASSLMAFCTLAAFFVALIAWINPWQCFGPHSLIEDAEEKLASAHNSQEVIRDPSREQTPLQDGQVHSYGSLWEDKKILKCNVILFWKPFESQQILKLYSSKVLYFCCILFIYRNFLLLKLFLEVFLLHTDTGLYSNPFGC